MKYKIFQKIRRENLTQSWGRKISFLMQYDDVITNPRWRTDAILKIVFGYISALYWPIDAKLDQKWRITCRYMSRDQNGNFHKCKMVDGRHFENSFISTSQPWLIRFRSNLVCRCEFPFQGLIFDKKIEILQTQDGGRTSYWKSSFWLYLGPYWPVNAKFGSEMNNHMQI